MALPKLSIATRSEAEVLSTSHDEEANIHGSKDLKFKMLDGEVKVVSCKVGETIFNIKKKLHDEFGAPFDVVFLLAGKAMMDPLSLNDFPELSAADVTIELQNK